MIPLEEQAQPSASGRLWIVDVARLAAIVAVLATHLHVSHVTHVAEGFWGTLWRVVSKNGSYGVSIFFVLSGFMISRMMAHRESDFFRPSLSAFYLRRAARILPLLIVVVVFGALMIRQENASEAFAFCFRDPQAPFNGWFWASIATFSFNWFRIAHESVAPNFGLHWDVLWSLAIEEQFYFLFPLALLATRNVRYLTALLLVLVLLGPLARGVGYFWQPHSFLLFYTNSFSGFGLIALGILLHLTADAIAPYLRQRRGVSGLLCAAGAAIALGTYAFSDMNYTIHKVFAPTVLGLGVFAFLLGGLHLKSPDRGPLRWLAWPGKLSYGMYLLHATVLFLLWPHLKGMESFQAFALFVLVTIGVAAVSFKAFELPLNRLLVSRLDRSKRPELTSRLPHVN